MFEIGRYYKWIIFELIVDCVELNLSGLLVSGEAAL